MGKPYENLSAGHKELVDGYMKNFLEENRKSKAGPLSFTKREDLIDIFRDDMSSPAGIRYIELNNAAKHPSAENFKKFKDDPTALTYINWKMRSLGIVDMLSDAKKLLDSSETIQGLAIPPKLDAASAAIKSQAASLSEADEDQIKRINEVQTAAIRRANGLYYGVKDRSSGGFRNLI